MADEKESRMDKGRREAGKGRERTGCGGGGELAHAQAIPAVLPAAAGSLSTHIIEGTSASACLSAQGFGRRH